MIALPRPHAWGRAPGRSDVVLGALEPLDEYIEEHLGLNGNILMTAIHIHRGGMRGLVPLRGMACEHGFQGARPDRANLMSRMER